MSYHLNNPIKNCHLFSMNKHNPRFVEVKIAASFSAPTLTENIMPRACAPTAIIIMVDLIWPPSVVT